MTRTNFSITLLCASTVLCIVSFWRLKHPPTYIPDFTALKMDSSTYINTKNIQNKHALILSFFEPDCERCQEEMKSIITNYSLFKDVQFYFVSSDSFAKIRDFHNYYGISKYPNITLAWDYGYNFIKFFKPASTPVMVIYDRHKEQKGIIIGKMSADSLYKITSKM
jgi:peroxiredoxin